MSELTISEMFKTINALCDGRASVQTDVRDQWYLRMPATEISNGMILRGLKGRFESPNEAIRSAYKELTNLPEGDFIVLNAVMSHLRRELRWNGFMWEDRKTVATAPES